MTQVGPRLASLPSCPAQCTWADGTTDLQDSPQTQALGGPMPTGIPSAVDLIIKADGINSPDLTLKVQVSRVPVSESEDEYLSSSRRHETALTSPVDGCSDPHPSPTSVHGHWDLSTSIHLNHRRFSLLALRPLTSESPTSRSLFWPLSSTGISWA